MTTTVKTCFKCGTEKPLARFYKHAKMADGHLNKCKSCARRDVRNHRQDLRYRSRVLAYDRARGNRQSPEYQAEYAAKKPRAVKAAKSVNNAIRDGRMMRGTRCETCGGSKSLHAHHDDYAMPLDVRWLCAACHRQWHAEHGEAPNAR